MNFSQTTIPAEMHQLPGLGDIDYIYSQDLKELTVNCNGHELMSLKGKHASMVYHQVATADDFKSPEELKVDSLLRNAFGMSIHQVSERTRERRIVEYRYLGMWWMRNNSKMHDSVIGGIFGGYDHATVHNAVKTVNNLMETNREFRATVQRFLNA